ncbi:TPA: transposase [Vibrio harveyi]|uniref:transposase n=1 Tax=Vibrio harveyi TaxID=669 RepID=UPI002864F723|nr:transposase family protein [Vibrio alginolyticus]
MTKDFIQLNDIIVPGPDEDSPITVPHIVVFIDATTNRLFAMNLKTKNKPKRFSFSVIAEALKHKQIICGELKLPDYMHLSDKYISAKQRTKRDQKLAVIRPIIRQLETFLVSRNYGKQLVKQCFESAQEAGIKVHRTQIYTWVYTFLSTGSIPNAFLRKPGSGQSRNKVYTKKTGPRRNDGSVGRMRTAEDEKNIRAIARKHIMCSRPLSYDEAFDEYKDRYASDPIIDHETGEILGYKHWSNEQRLSEHQFKAYLSAFLRDNRKAVIDQQGKTDSFNKDKQGLKGNFEKFYAEGPGHVYQIDETPLSIELVDEFDPHRQRRVGRPTCYTVVDTFSRAWVGLLLTFHKASAHTAREVIFAAFRNKQNFCDEIGVKLNEPWDISGKCRMILVDNAEFKAELERSFSKDAHIEQVYNTEGNSQQKGLVERKHKTLEDFLFGMVPGVSQKTIADHLKRKVRNDAILNIRELYQILIDFITRYNNHYPLETLPISKEMRRDGVRKIPMEKFNWGLRNRGGFLKEVDERQLFLELLEVGEVTIHPSHVFLPGKYIKKSDNGSSGRGLRYTCDWTLNNGLQEKNIGKRPRLSCRFMRYSMSRIYIETPEGLQPAYLDEIDSLYENMPGELIYAAKKKEAVENQALKERYSEIQSATRVVTKNTVDAAKHQQIETTVNEANTQDLSLNKKAGLDAEIAASRSLFEKMTNETSTPTKNIPEPYVDDASSSKEESSLESEQNSQPDISDFFTEKMASAINKRNR